MLTILLSVLTAGLPTVGLPTVGLPTVELPTVEEAVSQLIHGKVDFGRKSVVTVIHDFQFVDHNRDFVGAVRTFLAGNRAPKFTEVGGKTHVAGAMLGFAVGTPIECAVPMGRVDHIQMSVVGIKQLSLALEGADDVAEIQLGSQTRFRSQRGKKPRRWQNARGTDLGLTAHRIDITWKKSTLTIALDGRRAFRQKFAKGATPYKRLRFTAISGGDPALQAFRIKGLLHEAVPLVAANQGLLFKNKAPAWREHFNGKAPGVTVLSPLSKDVAAQAAKISSDALARYREILGAPPTFQHQVTVYLFEHAEVLRAYSGLGMARALSPAKIAAVYSGRREDAAGELAGLVVQSSVSGLSRSLPEWWEIGAAGYHREMRVKDGEIRIAGLPDSVKREARSALKALGDGGFGNYLREKVSCPQTALLSRAWLHFLIESDGGARRDRVRGFMQELVKGKTGEQAVDVVFSPEQMKQLRPAFETFLK